MRTPATISGPTLAAGSAPAPAGVETLPDLMDLAVARFADRPAIDFLGRVVSYREVGARVDKLAAGLARLGVVKGTRVGLLLPNTPYSVLFYYAILKAGGIVVNYNPLYTARELLTQIRDSGTEIMVAMDLERIYRPLATIAEEAGLAHIIVCPMADALPAKKAMLFRLFKRGELAKLPKDARHILYAKLIAEAPDAPETPPRVEVSGADVAVLQYTGGTTGVPKGAMLTHANLIANAQQIIEHAGEGSIRDGEERVLCVLPLFHIFAMTTAMNFAVRVGAEMILLPQFKLDQLLATIEHRRPTVFPAVPTIYGAINLAAEKRRLDLSSIRMCISGGAPLPQEVHARFEALTGCRLAEGYGLTEAAPVVSANPLDRSSGRPGSTGRAMPQTTVEIRDPKNIGQLMAQGEKGEICVRGPQVMAGYWQRPDDTEAVMVDGALRTGDIGYLDEDGCLFLVDRIKDLILCSGYNVYPRIIEEALYEHEAIAQAVVIGIPDAYRGESPKAFVTLKDDASVTPEALREFLVERLSKIEMPKEIEIRESLPKTMVGKLSKKELVAEEKLRAKATENA